MSHRPPARGGGSAGSGPSGQRGPDQPGSVRNTPPSLLAGCAVVGLVAGWSVRLLCLRAGWTEPRVSWAGIGLIWFLALVVGAIAWVTRQAVRRARGSLPAHQAVNRLALGKAAAVVGALLTGGYFGYALAQLGVTDSLMATTRLWHAVLAGTGGIALLVAALLLERACRVPEDPEQPPSL